MSPQHVFGLLLVVAAAYAALSLALFFYQPKMLYFPSVPSRKVAATPEVIGLRYESQTVMTQDGEKLDAWFVPGAEEQGVVLFFHGNAGNISHRLDSIALFHQLGLSVFIFDYRGYGRSSGRPNELGTYRDADAVWAHLTAGRGYRPQDIVVFGRSLGGAVAAYTAARYRPRALILESTFTSVPDLAADLYPLLPVRWISRFRYETITHLQRVDAPVLVVHSRDDEIIPFAHGERLYAAAHSRKCALWITGGHNDGLVVSQDSYANGLAEFLRATRKASRLSGAAGG